jgi:hypothetical protein
MLLVEEPATGGLVDGCHISKGAKHDAKVGSGQIWPS